MSDEGTSSEAKTATAEQLQASLDVLLAAPNSDGPVEMLCIRPLVDQRQTPDLVRVRPGLGVLGDGWSERLRSNGDPPHPKREIALIGRRTLSLLAGPKQRWSLAGDQIVLDLDLSEENLPVGQRLHLGSATLEITEEPHLGCGKFSQRFGKEALKFVNRPDLRQYRLRGVYAVVVEEGEIRVGDLAVVLRP